MRNLRAALVLALLLTVGVVATGCGGGSSSSASAPTGPATVASAPSAPTTTSPQGGTGGSNGTGALTAEAQATATGDVPDNQVFLTFANRSAGYSMKYPQGWAQAGGGRRVTIQDKNNLVRITVETAGAPSLGGVSNAMKRLQASTSSLRYDPPTVVSLKGKRAIKVVYSTESAPNPVTGKRVKLIVDRYYVTGVRKVAVVDLGTPVGVDNVDAYRLMIESFRWR